VGWLVNFREDRRHPLLTETIVGRSPAADLRLGHSFVSSVHCAITWNRGDWGVRDLGSHNGTAVNGELIPPKTRRRVRAGDEISFGQATSTWTLSDDGEPQPIATGPDDAIIVGERGLLVLPDAQDPIATVYRGAVGPWRLELPDSERETQDMDSLSIHDATWTLRLPSPRANTSASVNPQQALSLQNAALCVCVAKGDRGGSVVVQTEDKRFSFPLGATVDILRLLAEARVNTPGGWVDRERLLTELAMTGNRLNVAVFRLRRQFAEAGFIDAVQIVERSRRQLRLGTDRVTLESPDAP